MAIHAGNISGSASSTGSFGKVAVGTLTNLLSELTVEQGGSKRVHFGLVDSNAGIYATNAANSSDQLRLKGYRVNIGHTSLDLYTDEAGDVSLGRGSLTIPATEKLYFDGGGSTYIYESSDGVIDVYGDTVHLASFKQNGTQSEVVVNEGSGDVDFRVEANNESHAFFVEAAGSGNVEFRGANTKISGSSTSTGSFGQLHLIQDNSPSNPTLNFGDGDSGFYESSDDVIRVAIAGGHVYSIHSAAIQGNASNRFGIRLDTPTSTVPNFTPNYTDSNTGIGWSSADKLSLIAGGVGVEVTSTGISGSATSTGSFGVLGVGTTGGSNGYGLHIKSTGTSTYPLFIEASDGSNLGGLYEGASGNGAFYVRDASGTVTTAIDASSISTTGNILSSKVNGLISGSSTSTGSFGYSYIDKKIQVGGVNETITGINIQPDTHGYLLNLHPDGGVTTTNKRQFSWYIANQLLSLNARNDSNANQGTIIDFDHDGDIMFDRDGRGATFSGSASSTGSFGRLEVADELIIGGIDANKALSVNGTIYLNSSQGINWANGDASIIEGGSSNYALDFYNYDGSGNNLTMTLKGNHDVIFPAANTKISGSATSTGSFGKLLINKSTNTAKKLWVNQDVNSEWIATFTHTGTSPYGVSIDTTGNAGTQYTFGAYTQAGTGFFVLNNGNVGIGTTSPARTLDVTGTGRFTSNVDFGGSIYVSSGGHVFLDGGSNTYITEVASDQVAIFTGGSERFRVNASGNVGIGTTAPAQIFHISGSGNLKSTIESAGSSAGVQIKSAGEDYNSSLEFLSAGSSNGQIYYDHHATADQQKMIFQVGDGAVNALQINGDGTTTFINTMTIDSGGTSRITIDGNNTSGDDGNLQIYGHTSAASRAYLTINNGVSSGGQYWYVGALRGNNSFAIGRNNDFGTDTDMVVNSSGNVGIGTTAPSQTLTVEGHISASGNIYSDTLTAGRVVFVHTDGVLKDDADLTFDGNNLTVDGNIISTLANAKISGSSTSTGSFGKVLGDGSSLTGISGFDYTSGSSPVVSTNPSSLGATWINTTSGEIFVAIDITADSNEWLGTAGTEVVPAPSYFGGRGVFGGGINYPTKYNIIEYITIASTGNATDFGDLTVARYSTGACSDGTKGVFGGGYASSYYNVIEYITIATTGNATDFGDLTVARYNLAACSDGTKGVFGGGLYSYNTRTNVIDYVTIATTGNATDFGDLTASRDYLGACSDGTKGVFGGGYVSSAVDTIEYITIASTGNATDFGDLTAARYGLTACSDGTKGVFGGGRTSGAMLNTIEYITIATTGNAIDFGDLTAARYSTGACSDGTKGVWGGGYSNSTDHNIIDYITIASTGNATDFGDLSNRRYGIGACSGD